NITNNVSDNETFYNLIINKPSGEVFATADDDITIDLLGKMSFVNGLVNTNSIAGSLVIFQTSATSTGANSTSFVNGPVQKLTNNTTPFIFPVGDVVSGNNLYRPLTATPNSGSTSTFETEYTGIGFGDYSLGTGLTDVTTKEWWRMDRISGSANPVVTLSWGVDSDIPNELTATIAGLLVAHFDGTDWDSQGGTNPTGNYLNGTITATVATSVFGPFTLATLSAIPLSLQDMEFHGSKVKNHHILHWSLKNAGSVKSFIVEKSSNGIEFSEIGQVQVEASKDREFQFKNPMIGYGTVYYRIKSILLSGQISTSKIIHLSDRDGTNSFVIYPNPMEGQTQLITSTAEDSNSHLDAFLYHPLGSEISNISGSISEVNVWLNSHLHSLPSAVYLIRLVSSGIQNQVIPIVKK
ncbi:MAG: hypothetical protein K2Q22_15490, partial [Cytophagales bacterium]|nr:hypothetical protein [Cytophagales bacterium]